MTRAYEIVEYVLHLVRLAFRYLSCCSSFFRGEGEEQHKIEHQTLPSWLRTGIQLVMHKHWCAICICTAFRRFVLMSTRLEWKRGPPINNNKHREPFFRRVTLDSDESHSLKSKKCFPLDGPRAEVSIDIRILELTVMHWGNWMRNTSG